MARKRKIKQEPGNDKPTGKNFSWPADRIVRLKVDDLVPYARNARTHTNAQIEQLASAIKKFGFTNAVIVDDRGEIIAGHGRVMAARRLGLDEVPGVVIAAGEWSEDDRKAFRIWDNQSALLSDWDPSLLKVELMDLKLADYSLALTGFDSGALVSFMAFGGAGGNSDPEATPEPPVEPVSRLGDGWEMGSHRVLCGDCTSADDVARLLGKQRPHLMVTDPPYGVEYDAMWRDGYDLNLGKKIEGHFSGRATGKVNNDDRSDWSEAWALFPGVVAYIWHGGLHSAVVEASLQSAQFQLRAQIVWVKQHFVFSRGDYHWQHEPCWYAVRKGAAGRWSGDRKQTTVWQINNNNPFGTGDTAEKKTGHSTQKPIECMKRPIENNSQPGDLVYDPFLGSGTTLIAAEMTGRACLGMEIDPVYVDVIVRRWETFTKQKATLAETGKTFDEIARERGGSRASGDQPESTAA